MGGKWWRRVMIAAGTAHALYAQSRRKAVRRQTETQEKKKKKKKREKEKTQSRDRQEDGKGTN